MKHENINDANDKTIGSSYVTMILVLLALLVMIAPALSFGKYSPEEVEAFSANLKSELANYRDTLERRLEYYISSKTAPRVRPNTTANLVLAAELSSGSKHLVTRLIMNKIGHNQSYATYIFKVQTDKLYLSSKDKKDFKELFIILCLVASIAGNLQDFLDEVYVLGVLRELNILRNTNYY